MERNRLSAGETLAAVRISIESHLAYLQQHIRQHTSLLQQMTLLLSILGLGP